MTSVDDQGRQVLPNRLCGIRAIDHSLQGACRHHDSHDRDTQRLATIALKPIADAAQKSVLDAVIVEPVHEKLADCERVEHFPCHGGVALVSPKLGTKENTSRGDYNLNVKVPAQSREISSGMFRIGTLGTNCISANETGRFA